MTKKFSTDWKNAPLMGGVAVLAIVILTILDGTNYDWSNENTIIGFSIGLAILVFVALDGFFGIYVLVTDQGVYKIEYFFLRRGFKYAEIAGIYYYPTWFIANGDKTLSLISDNNGHRRIIRLMSNRFFKAGDINELAAILRQRAPHAKFMVYKPI